MGASRGREYELFSGKALRGAGLPIPRTDGTLAAWKSTPDKEINVQTGRYVPGLPLAPGTGS